LVIAVYIDAVCISSVLFLFFYTGPIRQIYANVVGEDTNTAATIIGSGATSTATTDPFVAHCELPRTPLDQQSPSN